MLRQAPAFLLGGGVLRGNASDEVRELVDSSGIPFILTPGGALPDSTRATSGCPACTGPSPRSRPCSARTC